MNYLPTLAPGSQGNNPSVEDNCVQFGTPISEIGQGGKLVLTFKDNLGLQFQTSIEYVKTNTVTDAAKDVQ